MHRGGSSPIDNKKPRTSEIGPRHPRYPLRLNHAPGKMNHPDEASEEFTFSALTAPWKIALPKLP
jgi:hypothetical protein